MACTVRRRLLDSADIERAYLLMPHAAKDLNDASVVLSVTGWHEEATRPLGVRVWLDAGRAIARYPDDRRGGERDQREAAERERHIR